MRQFIVLGFSTHSKNEAGKSLYLGGDRDQAISEANNPKESCARTEVYELANPHMRRHFSDSPEAAKKAAKKSATAKK